MYDNFRRSLYGFLAAGACVALMACGDGDGSGGNDGTNGTSSGDTSNNDSTAGPGDPGGSGGGPGLAEPGASSGGNGGSVEDGECGVISAVIRDFSHEHPDFESFPTYRMDNVDENAAYPGIVERALGSDNKPVYAHAGPTAVTTGPSEFAEWYNNVEGVNYAYSVNLTLEPHPERDGWFQYRDPTFFPLDCNAGWGCQNPNNPDYPLDNHYWFTTEIHTLFKYEGGEVFRFSGDDDLWIFVNGWLVLDLGGVHVALTGAVDFDALAAEPAYGIQPGGQYPMDIFHAERHTTASYFQIETSIQCLTAVDFI